MTVDDAIIYAEQKLGLTVDDAFDFLEMVLDSEDFQQWASGPGSVCQICEGGSGTQLGMVNRGHPQFPKLNNQRRKLPDA